MSRTVKMVSLVVGCILLSWLVVKFGDILFGFSLYGWFFRKIEAAGSLPGPIVSAIAVWCVAAVFIAGPTILLYFFAFGTKRRAAIIVIASAISIWFVLLYSLAGLRPKAYLFNPSTGATNYVYGKDVDGNIVLFPAEYRFDPITGVKLAPLDAAAAEQYRRQKSARQEMAKQAEALRQGQAKLAGDQAELQRRAEALRQQQSELANTQTAPSASRAVAPEATQPPAVRFNPGVVCDGDKDKTLDYSTANDLMVIVVPLKEGCYGPMVTLPIFWRANWNHKWGFQNGASEPGWVAFLAPQVDDEVGPFGLSVDPEKQVQIGYGFNSGGFTRIQFRLQGRGAAKFVLRKM